MGQHGCQGMHAGGSVDALARTPPLPASLPTSQTCVVVRNVWPMWRCHPPCRLATLAPRTQDEGLRFLFSKAQIIDELEATLPRWLQRSSWFPPFVHILKVLLGGLPGALELGASPLGVFPGSCWLHRLLCMSSRPRAPQHPAIAARSFSSSLCRRAYTRICRRSEPQSLYAQGHSPLTLHTSLIHTQRCYQGTHGVPCHAPQIHPSSTYEINLNSVWSGMGLMENNLLNA